MKSTFTSQTSTANVSIRKDHLPRKVTRYILKFYMYIIKSKFHYRWQEWKLDVDGTLPKDLESRGVLDESVLPNYPYRDDGILLYNALKEYVTNVLKIYYG